MNQGQLKAIASPFWVVILCRLGHYTVPREMAEVSNWLSSRLGLEGSS